jgi:hypothetical protein
MENAILSFPQILMAVGDAFSAPSCFPGPFHVIPAVASATRGTLVLGKRGSHCAAAQAAAQPQWTDLECNHEI